MHVLKSSRMGWEKHVARVGGKGYPYSVLVGKHEGRRPLRRPKCGWKNNIKKDFKRLE
jgi:hypothetical protein